MVKRELYMSQIRKVINCTELVKILAGRYISFEIHPFSFAEFIATDTNRTPREMFEKYLKIGVLEEPFQRQAYPNILKVRIAMYRRKQFSIISKPVKAHI